MTPQQTEKLSSAITTASLHNDPDEQTTQPEKPVLFFDGVCGLCSASVDFVIARDREQQFLFAPLQGETAARLLSEQDRLDLNSMVLYVQGRCYRKSSAAIFILQSLPGIWPVWGALLWVIPQPLRNWGYSLVAANRYRIFGQKETCRMPSPQERTRFLP